VVVELTTTEPVEPLGPAIVRTSPLIAVTLPATLAGTISIVPASVGSVELSAMCTLSPLTMSATVALCPFLVTVVEALIAYVDVVPRRSVMVMDVVETAETSPPMPQGAPGVVGIDDG
jgi:hypothetical protein